MSRNNIFELWEKTNVTLKREGNFRSPLLPQHYFSGQDYLCFSSNDYLALRFSYEISQAGYDNVLRNGNGAGASRAVLQCDSLLKSCEQEFSQFVGLAASLFFPSGFIAGLALFDALIPYPWENQELHLNQELFLDHRAHASLFYGVRNSKIAYQTFRHNDYQHLRHLLMKSNSGVKYVVVESLHSMDGDFLDAKLLAEICKEFSIFLIIDETHSLGIIGERGAGYLSLYPELRPYVLACIYGCGKAVGVSGGFLACCEKVMAERIFQKSRPLLYSTAPSPFITGAVRESLKIIQSSIGEEKRKLLKDNISYFNKVSKFKNFSQKQQDYCSSPIFSILIPDNAQALKESQYLLEKNIILRVIRPPSVPRGTTRLRAILRSDHSFEQIDYLLNEINF
ncbi:MAG: aminotransferase class I/II-fold pyridoxal phosphate-dependent enzyme [Silvanigrellaceae bacterium]|nr:aminotransferase class I/II-fold pyridoxal phosphate-dependent enzyme [Silvanigrellaceae bacterium]